MELTLAVLKLTANFNSIPTFLVISYAKQKQPVAVKKGAAK